MVDPPPAERQDEHVWALELADRAIVEAERRGLRVAVSIVDQRGDPIQQDRMDGAPTASIVVSETTAAAAATFQCPSNELATRYPGDETLTLLAGASPYKILPVAGGLPFDEDGVVVAGIGIGGPEPRVCEELVRASLGDH